MITAAIEGFEAQKKRIDTHIAELRAMASGAPAAAPAKPERALGKGRKFSAEAKQKMREAQQRRWAKTRGETVSATEEAPAAAKPKRRISEEGMQRIIAATKKRWAAKKEAAATEEAPDEKASPKKAGKKK
jgi:hypothetical protein